MRKLILLIIVVAGGVGVYFLTKHRPQLNTIGSGSIMQITSSAFANNATIPELYTCDGDKISPPLHFTGVSADAQSLVLIMDDPDATEGTFTHWVIYNMSPATKDIMEGAAPQGNISRNSAGLNNYTAPCPPTGEHRYIFSLYSIDVEIQDPVFTKKQLVDMMGSHVLDQAQLVGRYSRSDETSQ